MRFDNRKWYIGKRKRLRKCKGSNNWVYEKNKYRDKEVIGSSKEEKLRKDMESKVKSEY